METQLPLKLNTHFADCLAPTHMRGRYMGAFGLTWACGFIGPAIGMKLFALEPSALWLTCGGLGLLAAIIIFAAGKAQPGQPAQGERT